MASPDASVGRYRFRPRLMRPAGFVKLYNSISPMADPTPEGSNTVIVPDLSTSIETVSVGTVKPGCNGSPFGVTIFPSVSNLKLPARV